MAYISYDDYVSMGGTLDNAAFIALLARATDFFDYHTFDRLREAESISERVKRCIFALTGILADYEDTDGGAVPIAGASNDGVSVSYAAMSVKDSDELRNARMYTCIKTYLARETAPDGTPLLYRGATP